MIGEEDQHTVEYTQKTERERREKKAGLVRDADGYVIDDPPPQRSAEILRALDEGAKKATLEAPISLYRKEEIREFISGATRSVDEQRYDPEGFFSPLVFDRYCEYMHLHRVQPDKKFRPSDNWQKGLPLDSYVKGLWRHFLHFWTRHRGWKVKDPGAAPDIESDLCAVLFNAQGYLHELLRAKELDDGNAE